jgi:hypothetical protein
VIEVLAAVAGASVTVAAMTASNNSKRTTESRDAVIRLTISVDSVVTRLEALHADIRSRDAEVFGRLRDLEAAVARLEGYSHHN